MTVETLDLTYDGPAVADHTMNVRALAPSLLALADAFQSAQAILDPDLEPPTLDVVANPRGGSFIIEMVINYGVLATNILTSGGITALANAGGLVAVVREAIAGIKWLQNRPTEVEELQPGVIRYTASDGDVLEVSREASMVLEAPTFRAHINTAVAPVRQEGIRLLRIESNQSLVPPIDIEDQDAAAFEIPYELTHDASNVNRRNVIVNINSMGFRSNLKWRVSDGSSTFTATMDDPVFRSRMHRREVVFAEGDQLRVELVETQTRNPATGKLTTTRSIAHVFEHLPAPVQGELFSANDEDG